MNGLLVDTFWPNRLFIFCGRRLAGRFNSFTRLGFQTQHKYFSSLVSTVPTQILSNTMCQKNGLWRNRGKGTPARQDRADHRCTGSLGTIPGSSRSPHRLRRPQGPGRSPQHTARQLYDRARAPCLLPPWGSSSKNAPRGLPRTLPRGFASGLGATAQQGRFPPPAACLPPGGRAPSTQESSPDWKGQGLHMQR